MKNFWYWIIIFTLGSISSLLSIMNIWIQVVILDFLFWLNYVIFEKSYTSINHNKLIHYDKKIEHSNIPSLFIFNHNPIYYNQSTGLQRHSTYLDSQLYKLPSQWWDCFFTYYIWRGDSDGE